MYTSEAQIQAKIAITRLCQTVDYYSKSIITLDPSGQNLF
jgi:hypothetical protein